MPPPSSLCDRLSRKNLATHTLLSILCASLSPPLPLASAWRHLGPLGVPPVTRNRPNTSLATFFVCRFHPSKELVLTTSGDGKNIPNINYLFIFKNFKIILQ